MSYTYSGYGTVEGAEQAVRDDIDRQCKQIDSRSTGANFRYNIGDVAVWGTGDCVI
ncbi:hypothetical protein [Streptomyces sp. NPDC006668]|uniref:hypothetical protein n=1 Tax=Streptomyces sp. NPDC006668 TaxID=3156903 RepID=UPI003400356F